MARRRRHRRSGGRRNPFGLDVSVVKDAGWAIVGGVGTRSLPEMVLPAQNSGWAGYGLNLASAVALSMLGGRFFGPQAGKAVLLGGVVGTGLRIFSEQFGKNLGEFASLAGDPGFNLSGYGDAQFPLPWSGAALPPAAVQAAAPADF